MTVTPVLEIEGLTKRYGDVEAASDVNLVVNSGETVALLGASGSGKTTVLRSIAGLETPDEGVIRIDGRVMQQGRTSVPPGGRRLGMVFQNYALWPHMTAAQNIAFVARRQGGLDKVAANQRAKELLETFEVFHLAHHKPGQLSGGQQQRVAVARALAGSPSVVLMDEPLSALDATLRISLRREIRRMIAAAGVACVYVTHDQEEAASIADSIILMNKGLVVDQGSPENLYNAPRSLSTAQFFGCRNVLEGTVVSTGDFPLATIGEGQVLAFSPGGGWEPSIGDDIVVATRPEAVVDQSCPGGACGHGLRGRIVDVVFIKGAWELLIDLQQGANLVVSSTVAVNAAGIDVCIEIPRSGVFGFDRNDQKKALSLAPAPEHDPSVGTMADTAVR